MGAPPPKTVRTRTQAQKRHFGRQGTPPTRPMGWVPFAMLNNVRCPSPAVPTTWFPTPRVGPGPSGAGRRMLGALVGLLLAGRDPKTAGRWGRSGCAGQGGADSRSQALASLVICLFALCTVMVGLDALGIRRFRMCEVTGATYGRTEEYLPTYPPVHLVASRSHRRRINWHGKGVRGRTLSSLREPD